MAQQLFQKPYDRFSGSAEIDGTPTVLFPFTNLTDIATSFALWVLNDHATETVQVLVETSPDGVIPDRDSDTWVNVPPLQAFVIRRGDDETCRFWSLSAKSDGTPDIPIRWGVTIIGR